MYGNKRGDDPKPKTGPKQTRGILDLLLIPAMLLQETLYSMISSS
jgi:hypothetical protein